VKTWTLDEVLGALPDPDRVGQSEAAAVLDHVRDVLCSCQWDRRGTSGGSVVTADDLKLCRTSLEELEVWASAVRHDLRRIARRRSRSRG